MTQYFLYRTLQSGKTIFLDSDFLGGDISTISPKDLCICYEPTTLHIVGIYEYGADFFIQIQENSTGLTIRDCYADFSFVETINKKTSRMFKKKSRKITREDFDAVQKKL